MKRVLPILCLLTQFTTMAQQPAENYPVDSASIEAAGVPKGEVLKFSFSKSTIFPGTTRDCWIYVPAQYKPGSPACVYVNQDGIQWKAPTVFDNLIYKKEMPVTIGVFVTPGKLLSDNSAAQDRYNRSFEYDGLGDAYARFILTELLPEVEKQKTTDGRSIRLSKSGNDRAIGGSSSGAVCAFTAAWEHPEEFSRVFSAIGTYTGLRGADRYPVLIRKYEPKPIRIFLQDGSNDLLSALLEARYEDGSSMSVQQLRDEVMTLLLAGHETTAVTLSWVWLLLSQHPQVEQQLWCEIDTVLKGRPPEVRDIANLNFAEHVVKEAMRLYPPAWAIVRTALTDTAIGNYTLPAGSTAIMSQWVTHRDPRFYDEPEVFRPNRWLDEQSNSLPKFAYFPFGGGPRICIGASFAMTEAVLVLVTIAQKWQIRLASTIPPEPIPGITLRPRGGVKVNVLARS